MIKFLKKKSTVDLSGLRAGDDHYRAYVGPPARYDLISAMVFNLLTCIGLRDTHRVLDIGCGSLRVGRLLIPYLNPGNYVGVEPNKHILQEGIEHEVGRDLVRIKRPVFSYGTSLQGFGQPLGLDYAFAQSVFSHASKRIVEGWIADVSRHMKDTGAFVANFTSGSADYEGEDWVYPDCVRFRPETLGEIAERYGFKFEVLNWYHPTLTWAMFSRPGYDRSLIEGGDISWNRQARNKPAPRS